MFLNDPPYPDHPLFNWDFQMHPGLGSLSLYERQMNATESKQARQRSLERQARPFGFARALEENESTPGMSA